MTIKEFKKHRGGDIIEVRLVDNSHEVYFKEKANLNNPEQIQDLREKLKNKGVSL